jgi:hypothetical protein
MDAVSPVPILKRRYDPKSEFFAQSGFFRWPSWPNGTNCGAEILRKDTSLWALPLVQIPILYHVLITRYSIGNRLKISIFYHTVRSRKPQRPNLSSWNSFSRHNPIISIFLENFSSIASVVHEIRVYQTSVLDKTSFLGHPIRSSNKIERFNISLRYVLNVKKFLALSYILSSPGSKNLHSSSRY